MKKQSKTIRSAFRNKGESLIASLETREHKSREVLERLRRLWALAGGKEEWLAPLREAGDLGRVADLRARIRKASAVLAEQAARVDVSTERGRALVGTRLAELERLVAQRVDQLSRADAQRSSALEAIQGLMLEMERGAEPAAAEEVFRVIGVSPVLGSVLVPSLAAMRMGREKQGHVLKDRLLRRDDVSLARLLLGAGLEGEPPEESLERIDLRRRAIAAMEPSDAAGRRALEALESECHGDWEGLVASANELQRERMMRHTDAVEPLFVGASRDRVEVGKGALLMFGHGRRGWRYLRLDTGRATIRKAWDLWSRHALGALARLRGNGVPQRVVP